MKLLLAGTAVLLGLLAALCHAEVVKNFPDHCPQFFYRGKPPQHFSTANQRRICQKLHNVYHFATLFDPDRKIPVYSAYKLEDGHGDNDRPNWYYEPQVSDPNSGAEMQEYIRGTQIHHQATDEDYKQNLYTKGHLNPLSHNLGNDGQLATCTYTNAVPQLGEFNSPLWSDHENNLRTSLLRDCASATRYVIVGAVPSADNFIGVNGDVNVPRNIWSAYCCAKTNNNVGFRSGAYWATHNNNGRIKQMSVHELELEIGNGVQIFADKCGAI